LKGAYDDLADMATMQYESLPPDDCPLEEPLVATTDDIPEVDGPPANGTLGDEAHREGRGEEEQPLLEQTDIAGGAEATEDYMCMVDGATEDRRTVPRSARTSRRPRRRGMHRLYVTCMGCYICTLLFVGIVTFSAIYFFPKKPIFNICNDSVAWKSLIDSMTSMKATAEFEILASIYNPNHLDVALDMGQGSFSHDGALVGTYEIPPTVIAAAAISDILIVARFTPDQWQALSITAEYYHGTLVLSVDAQVSIRIPVLVDFTFSTSLKDLVVHVNEMSDRHLCACPTWSDASHNHTNAVPHWVQ
jgi:hypothetical protein